MAGCTGFLAGGGDCGKPDDDLADALPSGGDYEQVGEPSPNNEDDDDIEQSIVAAYSGSDDEQLLFGITEFSSADVAEERADEAGSEDVGDGKFGFVRVDEYVYFAWGPDRESVEALFAEAGPLDSGCVDGNVEWT